jgi:MFS family permease
VSWGEPPSNGGQGDPPGEGQGPDSPTWGQDPPRWGQDPPANRLRPLDLGDVLDGMFRQAVAHWRAFLIGLGIIVVPLALLSGLVATLAFGTAPGFAEMLQDPEVAQSFVLGDVPGSIWTLAGAAIFSAIAGLLLTPLIYGIAVHVAATGYRSGTADPMNSVSAAGRRYWGLLGTTILQGLVPFLIFLIPLVLLVAAGVGDAGALIAVGVLAFLASIVFVIIVAVRLVLAIPALLIERLGPVEALQRSNALVKGKTGMVLLTLIVVYIITAIIGFVLTLPFSAGGGAVGDVAGTVITTLGQMVSSLVTNALLGVAIVLIYFDRRVRNEGYDLTELAAELGEEPRDPPS